MHLTNFVFHAHFPSQAFMISFGKHSQVAQNCAEKELQSEMKETERERMREREF